MAELINELLGIRYPIIQGGMAWVATWELASAVSNAGGLGIIGVGGADVNWIAEQIRQMKLHTDKPFGVNLMLMNPQADEIAELLATEQIPVITTGAGNPAKYMKRWKEVGTKVIPVVASVALARLMERGGADAVIAEGTESGGHIGAATTMTLVPQVVDAVQIPVIAAGGIADARGFAAAMMLGAGGVQMGTRFVAAKESIVHENYKEKIIHAKDIDSEVIGRSTGHPIRVLRNHMTREYLRMESAGASLEELEQLTLGALRKAVVEGDVKDGSVMAGQIAGLVKSEDTCAQIIEEIIAGAEDEIDHFVLHQANSRIIESVAKRLRQPMEKFPMNLQDCGNISAASVPILLDSLNKGGKIQKNERIVLAGFGAGLTWGAAVIQW